MSKVPFGFAMFCFRFALTITIVFAILSLNSLFASVTTTGDIRPATDPETWNYSTYSYIGKSEDGTMTINGDSRVESLFSHIGYDAKALGQVTVDGANSSWVSNSALYVGVYGDGILNILNGGTVTSFVTFISWSTDSAGTINFGTNGGTLDTGTLVFPSPDQLTGTGTINTKGIVSDIDLVFDNSHGISRSYVFDGMGQNVALNVNFSAEGNLGVGYHGSASMKILDGIIVKSSCGYIGYQSDSIGAATVDGSDSTWRCYDNLHVGKFGHGTLHVINGGIVNSGYGYLGNKPGSFGEATVEGINSIWKSDHNLSIGHESDGILNIIRGGLVCVNEGLLIDQNGSNNSFINMATGGMLALPGDTDDSLNQFFDQIYGTAAIRYWDTAASDWAFLTGANRGTDYTLEYRNTGDLTGYTVLTVNTPVPEPSAIVMLLLAIGLGIVIKKRGR